MSNIVTHGPGWTTVAFGDVVRLSRERSTDPAADGYERFIGLEHIDPDDLRVRRWGNVSDGVTFTSVFRPGHVLFGKRRAYQRKVAVADFAGVCSGDIYVLEPSDERLLPELLPFICQTDAFYDHAVGTSAGSLSPRTNWESLSEYTFALPPLEEQRRIVAVLLAAKAHVDRLVRLHDAVRALYESAAVRLFTRDGSGGMEPHEWRQAGWNCKKLEALVVPDAPVCYGIVQVGDAVAGGVPTLAINNLDGDFIRGVHATSPAIESAYGRSRIRPHDVLVSIKGTIGKIAIVPDSFTGNISRDVARIRLRDDLVRPRFFYHLYRTPQFRRYIESRVVGSTRAELSIALLRTLDVPVPSLEVQDRVSVALDAVQDSLALAGRRRHEAERFLKGCIRTLSERVGVE